MPIDKKKLLNELFENIPNELANSMQWVVHNAPLNKIPINPNGGGNASSTDPETWASLDTARRCVESGQAAGVGYVFVGNGIYGVDLDSVRDPQTGYIAPEALRIIEQLDSYTEISPSGYGFHIFVRADGVELVKHKAALPPNDVRRPDIEAKTGKQKTDPKTDELLFKKPEIEVYDRTRYFTVTGEVYGELKPINERTDAFLAVYSQFFERENPRPKEPPSSLVAVADDKTDDDYLKIGLERDKKFRRLWDGERPNGNESSDDQGLMNKLAYWCGRNADLIEQAFFSSPHYKSKDTDHLKKCEREDYIKRTIARAIEDLKFTARENNAIFQAKLKTVSSGQSHLVVEGVKTGEDPQAAVFINPLSNPRRYTFNDIGLGHLFADTFKNVSRFVPEAKSWYCYDGKVWRQDVESLRVASQAKDLVDFLLQCASGIEDLAKRAEFLKFVIKATSNQKRKVMIEEARSVYPIRITEFDVDPNIFNCQNCTLDLNSFTMHPHRASDYLSKISNVVFDKSAGCERWNRFITEIMQDDFEKAKFLQKALGYALTGETSFECFFILYGATTRNGKGTTMESFLHLMGDYGKTAQPESIAQRQNPNGSAPSEDIARLRGARFVNMSEPEKGMRLNASLVKTMTGSDTMTARFLHQNSFEFIPGFKLFINTNYLPKVTDDSIFSSGRVKLIPFERHFEPTEQDKGLKALFRQPENISGIFNWAVEGLKLLRSEGLEQPESVAAATNEYREESDTVGMFITDCMEPSADDCVKLKDVYARYKSWCLEFGYAPKNKTNLKNDFERMGKYKRHRTFGYVIDGYVLLSDFAVMD